MYRQHNMGGLMGLHLPDGDLMQLVPSEVHGLHLGMLLLKMILIEFAHFSPRSISQPMDVT